MPTGNNRSAPLEAPPLAELARSLLEAGELAGLGPITSAYDVRRADGEPAAPIVLADVWELQGNRRLAAAAAQRPLLAIADR